MIKTPTELTIKRTKIVKKKINRTKWQEITQTETLDLTTLIKILKSPEGEKLVNSREAFNCGFEFELTSGERIPLWIDFYGKNYRNGYPFRHYGNLVISTSSSYLWRSIDRQIVNQIALNYQKSDRNLIHSKKHRYTKEEKILSIHQDSEDLFLEICGLLSLEQEETYIEHAVMYYEMNFRCSLTNQMIYHRNPIEFAQDFERIYIDYLWGAYFPLLLSSNLDIWQLSSEEISNLGTHQMDREKPGKDKPELYKFYAQPRKFCPELQPEEIIDFLESLEPQIVKKLTKLPVSFIKLGFKNTEQRFPEVRYYDCQEQGMVLISGALSSVWRPYRYLAQLALNS
jgi:hypothetical protein